jgi:ubiquinone/menaquinone biosynthesis C-methylase UbiE
LTSVFRARHASRKAGRCAGVVAVALALSSTTFAQLASRPVDEWIKVLDSPERLTALKVDEVVARLHLNPGDVIADLGAGTGPFVVPFARAVPSGTVYAVEVDQGFFPYIRKKADAAGVANVRTVLGEFTDPKLPASDADVAFMHDVLHHIADRSAYVKSLSRYLKPGARVAIIDYHPANSPHKDQPALQVSKEQATALFGEAGFKPVEDIALFTDKWFLVFGR